MEISIHILFNILKYGHEKRDIFMNILVAYKIFEFFCKFFLIT